MQYSALTSEQKAQVTCLFADESFNTDPAAYQYEVKAGNVIGRTGRTQRSTACGLRTIVLTPRAACVTDDQIQTARMNMDALAVSIARKVKTLEEVQTP